MKMKAPYLEVTFRKGRMMAAYLHLPRPSGTKSFRTAKADPGLIVDLDQAGQPIGIEITAPEQVRVEALNRVLESFQASPVEAADLAPLRAA